MVKGKFLELNDDLSEVYHIYKEENISTAEEYENTDLMAVHVLVNDGTENVAAGTISMRDMKFYIDHVVVREKERNKYYGDFIVRMLIDKAFQSGASRVYTISNIESAEFFQRIGFQLIKGSSDYEVNNEIPMCLEKSEMCRKCCH